MGSGVRGRGEMPCNAVAERSAAAFFFLVSAIFDATTERIFEESGKGMLASL